MGAVNKAEVEADLGRKGSEGSDVLSVSVAGSSEIQFMGSMKEK